MAKSLSDIVGLVKRGDDEILEEQEKANKTLESIDRNMKAFIAGQRNSRLDDLETKREKSRGGGGGLLKAGAIAAGAGVAITAATSDPINIAAITAATLLAGKILSKSIRLATRGLKASIESVRVLTTDADLRLKKLDADIKARLVELEKAEAKRVKVQAELEARARANAIELERLKTAGSDFRVKKSIKANIAEAKVIAKAQAEAEARRIKADADRMKLQDLQDAKIRAAGDKAFSKYRNTIEAEGKLKRIKVSSGNRLTSLIERIRQPDFRTGIDAPDLTGGKNNVISRINKAGFRTGIDAADLTGGKNNVVSQQIKQTIEKERARIAFMEAESVKASGAKGKATARMGGNVSGIDPDAGQRILAAAGYRQVEIHGKARFQDMNARNQLVSNQEAMRKMRAADVQASNLDSNRRITAAGGVGGNLDEISNKGIVTGVTKFSKGAKALSTTLKTATTVTTILHGMLNPLVDLYDIKKGKGFVKFLGWVGLALSAKDAVDGGQMEVLRQVDKGGVATYNEVAAGSTAGVVQGLTGIFGWLKKKGLTMTGTSEEDAAASAYGPGSMYAKSGEVSRYAGSKVASLVGLSDQIVALETELRIASGGFNTMGPGKASENFLADYKLREARGLGMSYLKGEFLNADRQRFDAGQIMGADGKPISQDAYLDGGVGVVGSLKYNVAKEDDRLRTEYMKNVTKDGLSLNDYAKRLDALVLEIQNSRAARETAQSVIVNNNNTTGTSSSGESSGGGTMTIIDIHGGAIPGYQ